MTADRKPVTLDQVQYLRRLEDVLQGSRIMSVHYVPLELDSGARNSWSSRLVHEIDLDVVIILDAHRLRITWARDDRVEGLGLTIEDEADPTDPLLPPPVVVDFLPAWEPVIGSVVTAVGKAWQQNEDTCPPSLWSLRLSTSAGRDVVVALGELDEKLEKLLYHPDALLVIFDEATARSYTTGMKSGNAWGSGGLP